MPNDAELRRTGISFTRAFSATAMCSPSRASVLTGKYPSRHGVKLTLTEGDLFPDRRNVPDVLRTFARLCAQPRGPAPPPGQPLPARAAAARAEERQRAGAAARLRHAGHAAARARLPRGAEGQVAPVEAGQRARLGAAPTRSGSSATTASRSGSRRTPAATRRRRPSAAATPARPTRAGTRTTRARSSSGSGASGCRSRSASWSRWSTRTTCWAIPTRSSAAATRPTSSAGSACRCLRPSTRTCATKPTVHSLMKLGQTAYIGALRDEQARRDYVNFYAYLHRVVDEKIGRAAGGARGPRRPRVAALAHRDRAHLGPRGAGPLPRRAAPEDVQRLRGVDPRAAGDLEPGPVPAAARERRAGVAGRRGADAARAQRRGRATRVGSTASTWARSWPARRTPSATPCCSPTTTTRPGPRSRTCPVSPTGSAACATRAGSTRSTSIPPAERRPSTSCTTSRTTPTRPPTSWTSGPGAALSDEAERERVRHARAARARLRRQRHARAAAAAGLVAGGPLQRQLPRSARRGCCDRGPVAPRS